jgi:hypothetical protein
MRKETMRRVICGLTLTGMVLAARAAETGQTATTAALKADFVAKSKDPQAFKKCENLEISDFCRRLEFCGIALRDDSYHFWGASPIWGPDNKVHLFASRWPVDKGKKANGFWGLLDKCELAHYIADQPEGPFVFSDVALRGQGAGHWDACNAHNPDIKKVGDSYVLSYTSLSSAEERDYQIGMAVSKNLNGPWKRIGEDGLVLKRKGAGQKVTNPYLVVAPSGKLHLYYRANAFVTMVATADELGGPYTLHPKIVAGEDPCVFIENGKFYLLNHRPGVADYSPIYESDDGLGFGNEKIGFPPLSYYCGTKSEDGKPFPSYFAHFRGDMPKILLKDGKPTYIYLACGANTEGGPGSCNYVFAIHPATTAAKEQDNEKSSVEKK